MDRFEDSIAWQKARELNKAIYVATRSKPCADDREFIRQLRRASISVMNNIAEGFERFRPNEQHQFLSIAKGSAGEVRSMLYAGLDLEYWKEDEFSALVTRTREVTRLLASWIRSIERRQSNSWQLREDESPWDLPLASTEN